MKKVYDYYQDKSHGWLKVSLKELVDLDIHKNISKYSYINKLFVYLEEDSDAPKFIKAKKDLGVDIKVREHVARERYSKIRSYFSYIKEV